MTATTRDTFRLGGIELEWTEGTTAQTPDASEYQKAVVKALFPDPEPGASAEWAAMMVAHRLIENGTAGQLIGAFVSRAGEPQRNADREVIRRAITTVLGDVGAPDFGLAYQATRALCLRWYRSRLPVLAERAHQAARPATATTMRVVERDVRGRASVIQAVTGPANGKRGK